MLKALLTFAVIVCLLASSASSLTLAADPQAEASGATPEQIFLATKAKAEAGEIDAQYKLAGLYKTGQGTAKDEREAVKWFRIVAEQNDPRGQSMLGVVYTNGQGVERDYDLAIDWFRKAAAQHSAHAKYNLGYMYAVGKGVIRDQGIASDWYRQAAEQNDNGSQRILGSRFATGNGVEKDLVQAYAWTQVSLPRGGQVSQQQLLAIEAEMTPEQIAAAKRVATEIMDRIAKMGSK